MFSSLSAIEDCGLIPNDKTKCEHNSRALEDCVVNNTVLNISSSSSSFDDDDPNDEKKLSLFWLHPGIQLNHLENVVLAINGRTSLNFQKPPYPLPRDPHDPFGNHPVSCLNIAHSHNITVTSSSSSSLKQDRGLLNGGGPFWWGIPGIGYLKRLERRPKLLQITTSTSIDIFNLNFQDAPLYTLYLNGVKHVTIHNISIVNRRTERSLHSLQKKAHTLLDLTAFNTDGIDIAGHNISISDADIWTQDDCIAIKDNYLGDDDDDGGGGGISRDIRIHNVNASGLGFVIGSIGGGIVENVTFSNSLLYHTFKGIYLKFRDYDLLPNKNNVSRIQNILFENITMIEPEQWAIWMGPAQQMSGNSHNPCAAKPCSLCWPTIPGAQCLPPSHDSVLDNVTLRNISIINPIRSPGVLLGGIHSPLGNIEFDHVKVLQGGAAWQQGYQVLDLRDTFPGLVLHNINDPYVKLGLALLIFLFVAIGSLVVGLLGCRRVRHQRRPGPGFMRLPSSSDDQNETESSNLEQVVGSSPENDRTTLPEHEDEGPNNDESLNNWATTMDEGSNNNMEAGDSIVVNDALTRQTNAMTLWNPLLLRCRQNVYCFSMVFLLVVALVVVASYYYTRLHYKLSNVDKYFVCSGVQNGVAKGSTWPTPHCFRDETINNNNNNNN